MSTPHESLPKALPDWADLKAAYRLLSNERVDPHAIQLSHRQQTLEACGDHDVVLCVQDTTCLDLTSQSAMKNRGDLGGGTTRGLLQHSALAIVPGDDSRPLDQSAGRVLGVLHQTCYQRAKPAKGETLRELQKRRTDADVWGETASAVAQLGPTSTRIVHVGDRHSDVFRFLMHCNELNHGYLVRAQYDRKLTDEDGHALHERLFDHLQTQEIAGQTRLMVHEQRTRKGVVRCAAREVTLSVRFASITIDKPQNDVRTNDADPIRTHAVMVEEMDPQPAPDTQPLRWMLLTSEPVNDAKDAWRMVRWYRHRWIIEEWHRVLKEGCRIERVQFDDAQDVARLAAIKGLIAVRLLQLRDLAERSSAAGDDAVAGGGADDQAQARMLEQVVPRSWRVVVSKLAKVELGQLTPQLFYLTIAKRGGYLNRKHDSRPGWKVLWRGWHDVELLVQGYELFHP